MPTTTIMLRSNWRYRWGGSIFANVGEFDDLHAAGIDIENASRSEYQIELQPEPNRSYGIGRENRTGWQCPVAPHHHQKRWHDYAVRVCGKDGVWGQEDAARIQ